MRKRATVRPSSSASDSARSRIGDHQIQPAARLVEHPAVAERGHEMETVAVGGALGLEEIAELLRGLEASDAGQKEEQQEASGDQRLVAVRTE